MTVAQAQVEVTELCVPYDGVMVAGVAPGTTTLDHVFNYNKLSSIQALASAVQDLQFVRVDATTTSGVTSFDFVSAAHVSVASGDPTSPLPTLEVYDCDGDCVPDGSTLSVPSTFAQSAIAYVETGSLVVDLEIDGQLPVDDWTMDMDFCFSGELGYNASL